MLTLHHQPDRRERYAALRPFRFDEQLNCLSVFDARLVEAVFRSDKFDVIFFADQYRYITEHTPLDFGPTIAAFDHIPLANEGERHRQTRSEIASVIGAGSREKIKLMEEFVADHTRRLFAAGNEIELAEDFAKPIFLRLFSLWLDVDHSNLVDDPNFSQVFDMKMSLNRRKRINRNVGELTCAFAQRRDDIPTTPEFATAMNILGNDALKGSISLSLWDVLAHNPGIRLDRIDYPKSMPSTGVPYIERVAREDVEIDGMKVARDQRVRLYLDATTYYVSGEENDVLFGKGKHVCLGKPMSLALWRSLAATLASIPLHFTTGEMKLRSSDYAFNCLEYAKVRIHE
jgi:cytochrome P450